MISKSYPYLSIAKKHGCSYGMVLAYAEQARNWPDQFVQKYKCGINDEFIEDIADAARHFLGVRSGVIAFE